MATVKIIEQPANVLRFQYERETLLGALIVGTSSTPENVTYPTIQVEGYQGRALVIASCVTKDAPYRPHPHKLVGMKGCKKGICALELSLESMSVEFTSLGIQRIKRRDIEGSLTIRKAINVDPFQTGFASSPKFDLTTVRLCFQLFLQSDYGDFRNALQPIVSEPIYDQRFVNGANAGTRALAALEHLSIADPLI